MKHLIIPFVSFILLLASCSESFKSIDPKEFNKKIANITDIKTPEELITLYYNHAERYEGKIKSTIQTENLNNNTYKITLIQEGLGDDSVAGEKIIMTAKKNRMNWFIIEIKKNWKCWADRGHTSWGTKPCD